MRAPAYRTDFGKSCFDDYLSKKLPVMLVEHDKHKLIGHAIAHENNGVRNRLVGQFSDLDAVPLAREYFAHIRDGDIPGWSFHFRNAKSIPHPTVRAGRRFTQAEMPEFGPTVFPAIPGTSVAGLRSESSHVDLDDPRTAAEVALQEAEISVFHMRRGDRGRRGPRQPWELADAALARAARPRR